MSSALVGLADELMVNVRDPTVLRKLGSTMENIISLAQGSATSSAGSGDDAPEAYLAEEKAEYPSPQRRSILISTDPKSHGSYRTPLSSYIEDVPLPTPSHNIFGNGWFDMVATTFTQSPSQDLATSCADHIFAFRLVQANLELAYHAMVGTPGVPPGLYLHLCSFALRYHTREQLLFNTRWYLGPGLRYLHRLGNASFASKPLVGGVFQPGSSWVEKGSTSRAGHGDEEAPLVGVLSEFVDSDAVADTLNPILNPPVSKCASEHPDEHPFINAIAVEQYLKNRGFRNLGAEYLELDLSPSAGNNIDSVTCLTHAATDAAALREYASRILRQDCAHRNLWLGPGPMELGTFFPPVAQKTLPIRSNVVRVSQQQLMMNLVSISLCLAGGPGYRRAFLDGAIAASIVP